MKRCPSCSTPLSRRRAGSPVNPLEIDACAGCGGIWLDDGELSRLNRENPAGIRQLSDSVVPTQPAMTPQRTGVCPKDSAALSPFEYPGFEGIFLDGCPTCKGVWFDRGELATLGDRLSPRPAVAANTSADGGVLMGAPAGYRGRRADASDPTSTAGLPVVRGFMLTRVPHDGGFFGALSRGWAFISGAYALAFEQKALLLPIVFGSVAGLAYAAGWLGFLFYYWTVTGGPAFGNPEVWAKAHPLALFVSTAAWALGGHFISYFSMGMTVSMLDAYLKGRDPKLGVAFADSLKNIGGIFALAVVDTLVNMLVSSMKQNRRRSIGGLIMGMIGEAIQAAWTVLSFLLLPVIMIEDTGLVNALTRVRDVHKRNVLQIAVGEVGIRTVAGIVGFVFILAMVPVAFVLFPLKAWGIGLFIAIFLAGVTVIGVLNSFAKAAYYTCLYLWAAETERLGERALVPAPLAVVFR